MAEAREECDREEQACHRDNADHHPDWLVVGGEAGIEFRGSETSERERTGTVELGVAVAAVIISLVSFVVNLYASRTADRHARMPVLIAQWYKAADGGHRVSVRNIGKGPAVNVVIANALGELATTDIRRVELSRYKNRRHWGGHKHLERIPEGAALDYPWDSKGFAGALGLTYTDVLGSPYTLLSGKYGTKAVNAAIIPHPPLNELKYPQEP